MMIPVPILSTVAAARPSGRTAARPPPGDVLGAELLPPLLVLAVRLADPRRLLGVRAALRRGLLVGVAASHPVHQVHERSVHLVLLLGDKGLQLLPLLLAPRCLLAVLRALAGCLGRL